MKTMDYKKYLPYLIAVVIFILISTAYVSPVIEGKMLRQGDIINFKGMSEEIKNFREKTGQEALWTNSMFSGMPAYQISVLYTSNLMYKIDKVFQMGLPHPAGIIFLYMIGFFLLLLVLKIDPWLSVAGAIAFGFSSYFFIILEAGHNSKAHAIAYMAPVIASVILTYRGKYVLGGILTALFLSIEISCNHLQITYYLLIILLLFAIFDFVKKLKEKQLLAFSKASAVVIFAAILSLGPNITSLWATYEYGKETIRGTSELSHNKADKTSGLDKGYATGWSYGVSETFTLLIPNFKGGSSNADFGDKSQMYEKLKENGVQSPEQMVKNMPGYWGTQPFTSGPVYAGAIIFFLFILGLFIVKGELKWWLLAAALVSITLAWGKNFMFLTDIFMNYVPGYNKFRTVSMTLVIAELVLPLLGIVTLQKLLNEPKNTNNFKWIKIIFGVVGGLTLIIALLSSNLFDFTSANDDVLKSQRYPQWFFDALFADRARMLKLDALRSFAFITIFVGVLWAYFSNKLKKNHVYIIVIFLILFDMWGVNKRYLNNDNFVNKREMTNPFTPSDADNQILQNELAENPSLNATVKDFADLNLATDYRVFNVAANTYNDASTSYFHKSIGGYHGAKLRRYQDLIDAHLSGGKNMNTKVLNMLNTKYFIVSDKDRGLIVQRNMYALGNAWFVQNIQWVNNADEEIAALKDFDPSKTAVVDIRFKNILSNYKPSVDTTLKVKLLDYKPNKLIYQYDAKSDGLIVFSEIYYAKGWNAYIDGKLTPHFRTDYVLRAMTVPSGNHKIEFKFEPRVYIVGEKVALGGSIILLVLLVLGGAYEIRKSFAKK